MTAAFLLALTLLQTSATYSITGTMVLGTKGTPLEKVRVSVTPTSGRAQLQSMVTAADGKFRFNHLPGGKYRLEAERLGFLHQSYQERTLFQGYSTAVAVGPEDSGENLEFRMIPGGVIAGFVKNGRGEPVPGVVARVFRIVGAGANQHVQQLPVLNSFSVTDDRGYYRVHSLPAGNFVVAVAGEPNQAPEEAVADAVAFPVIYYPGVTNRASATLVRVNPGQETRADIIASPLPSVEVKVTAPATVGQGSIVLSSPGPYGSELPFRQPQPLSGSQVVFEVPPGRYSLTLYGPREFLGRRLIDVTAGNREFSIGETPAVRLVVDLELQGDSDPKALKPSTVRAVALDGEYWYSGVIQERTARIASIPGGRHQIVVLQNGQVALPVISIKAKGSTPVVGDVVNLPETGVVELSVVVDASPVTVPGRVYRGQKPESGVLLMLVPKDNLQNTGLYRFDQSDSDGTFSFQNTTAGEYLAFTFTEGEVGDYWSPEAVRQILAQGQAVTVGKGVPVEIRLALPAKDPK